jgi:two-component system, chemotaxis family, CheB/CheR fusion protein
MTEPRPDQAEESNADDFDNIVPSFGYEQQVVVGLGGSAGSIPALQDFFRALPKDPGLAFVVVMHLSPEHESTLAEILQRVTPLKVVQVIGTLQIEPDHVYVIPPRFALRVNGGHLALVEQSLERGHHVAVDLFFRTLADTHGPHAAAVVLSGADGDGAIGIKRIKERGGLTVAQDPEEAQVGSMPRSAIATGMVDWVLPVADIPQRLLDYFRLESRLKLPPEDGPQPAQPARTVTAGEEASLRDVLMFLRTRTGRDFSYYKRATILRRIGRRMQVNGVADLQEYLDCLRTRPGEPGALLDDLLISVTNFFRDPDCFDALAKEIPALLAGKGPNDAVRVWVAACATGEEAYSVAMLLSEHARAMDAPPAIQVFATDLDGDAVQSAREGVYPAAIEADVSEDRLKRFFVKEHRGYRVRRELREMVLFAMHDVLKDSPFSRLDLVTCRNLLIYLNRDAQQRVFETFHFALVPGGTLFLGSSESVEDVSTLFTVVDKKNRVYRQRPTPRAGLPVPTGPATLSLALQAQASRDGPVSAGAAFRPPSIANAPQPEPRTGSWSELHLRLLEMLAPPSVLVDAEYEIVHLSASAGRFLQFSGGEPTRNLLRSVNPDLRIELRAALYEAAQSGAAAEVADVPVDIAGQKALITIRVLPAKDMGAEMFLVVLNAIGPDQKNGSSLAARRIEEDAVARQLDRELERLNAHLRDTVEQYEASTEELKASNEELQAMNEELRSATEELETSREELQSINEELTTVNHELKNKVDELAHANSDMHNLMDATAIATVFLDRDLHITRYTPSAISLFNLIPGDVGRPLSDLKTQLHYPELGSDAARVLEKLVPIEREVGQSDGWYLARLLPYRTIEDRIAGVLLSFIDISERKEAEEMRLWLSAVVTASSDAIISFSLDGTILSWNQGAERIFGLKAEEAIGSPLAILAPGDGAKQSNLIATIASAQAVESHETVHRRKDGTELHVAITVSPIRDDSGKVMAGTAMVRDISVAKRAEEALRQSEERFRLVIENATEYAIFSMDLQRRVTVWNSGAQALLGYRSEEIVGTSADIVFTPEDRAAREPDREAETALAEGRASDERWHMRKDGSRFWASGAAMLMRNRNGEAVGFVKILRDQTAARESRQALERSQTELLRVLGENEHARAELQTADTAKDRFLAVLSHELRNPLASINSASELLLSSSLGEGDAAEAAHIVQRQASTMKALLDELLDVSRLKLGRLEIKRERVLLSQIVGAALEATKPLLAEAGHTLSVDLPPGDVELEGDALRLSQVLSNLLVNAIRYTPRAGRITLAARLDGDRLALTVTDTGIGMEPARIASMFEMFTQGAGAADRAHGLGIGLALVKNIVELHGGRVSARSEGPGRGSEFCVELPNARRVAAAQGDAPATSAVRPVEKRGLILVADDNTDAGWGVAKLLEISGYETLRARDGAEALAVMQQRKPQAAIIDIGMPGIDGHEVARRARAAKWGQRMALIAATGWGQEADESAALEAGFDAHMTKPLDMRRLSGLLDDLLASAGRGTRT